MVMPVMGEAMVMPVMGEAMVMPVMGGMEMKTAQAMSKQLASSRSAP